VRDRDRWWWWLLSSGLALCVVGVVALYVGLQITATNNPSFTGFTSDDSWQLMGLVMLIFLGIGVTFVVMAVQARGRHRRRLAALQGEASAMPLAQIRVEPALAPDVAEQPLRPLWRTGAVTRFGYGPLLGIYAVLALLSVGLTFVTLVVPLLQTVSKLRHRCVVWCSVGCGRGITP